MLTENDIKDISRLIELLNKVIDYVVEKEGGKFFCKEIIKSLRILKDKKYNGFSNLHYHIIGDFRMMVDRGLYGEQQIDKVTDEVCGIIKSNRLFHK